MANFSTSGMDQLIKALDNYGKATDDMIQDILFRGGEIIADKIRLSCTRAGHIRSGSLLNGIQLNRKVKKTRDGGKAVYVVAKGKDESGMPNATKAVWLNLGTSKMRGSRFWTRGEQDAKSEVEKLAEEINTKTLKEKGLL